MDTATHKFTFAPGDVLECALVVPSECVAVVVGLQVLDRVPFYKLQYGREKTLWHGAHMLELIGTKVGEL